MLILSWNVRLLPDRPPDNRTEQIDSARPDIVTLQEVSRHSARARAWVDRLRDIGLVHCHLSGEDISRKSYQCLIASRWKVTPVESGWRHDAPYPELLGRATVSVPDGRTVDVFTAHIPNGSNHGWKKIDTFHVLAAELRRASALPRILTGDFNEPKKIRESGQIVTWRGTGRTERWRDKFGDERPLIEWRNGVCAVLNGKSAHGLSDAYRDCHGIQPPDLSTWRKYCYDHTFVSRHFEVLDCGYYHNWRHQLKLSDHSPMWTELRLRADVPE